MESADLLTELQPAAEANLERHLATAKEWFPHEFVPWERGADLDFSKDWDPSAYPLPDAVRSALFVNLLTEDNLPYYYATINRNFGSNDAWGVWTHRWTAEEDRHAMVIRDYLTVTQAIDPVALERARMHQMSGGIVPEPPDALETMVYVSLQELATRISHRNTGKLLTDPAGLAVMARVAADENLHYLFYRDVATSAIELDPSAGMMAIDSQVRGFEMPGTGIPDFGRHAKAIADAGIYDLILHYEQILVPVVMRHWDITNITGLDDEAERARDRVVKYIERMGRAARRLSDRRDERNEQAEGSAESVTSSV